MEYLSKGDKMSPDALKAMFNNGAKGFDLAMNYLANQKDPQAVENLLKNASDHVTCEQESEATCKKLAAGENASLANFCKQVLQDCTAEDAD